MARKLEFDYARAVGKATMLFWKKGYSNTSLRGLLKVMGIGEGSFYNALGSKRRLYQECLKHYDATVSRRRLDALRTPESAKDGIRAFFRAVLDELDAPGTPRVCLLAGSLSADVLAEPQLKESVLHDIRIFSRAFIERLKRARETGELPSDYPSEVAAAVILTYLQGLFRVVHVLQSRADVERQIALMLQGLGL